MQIGCKYRIFMPLKPWGSSIVLIQGQILPRVCVMQLCNFVWSWVTENMQKKWCEGKELGNKIGKNWQIPVYILKNNLRGPTVVCKCMQSYFIVSGSQRVVSSSFSITWKLKRNANSQVPPQSYRNRNSKARVHLCFTKAFRRF